MRAGFMERPCLPDRLREAEASCKLGFDAPDVTFYIGRETFLRTEEGEMGRAAESLFAFLYNTSSSASSFFGLPPERVMEVGMHIDL
jgi:KUP system potassium uptake protein